MSSVAVVGVGGVLGKRIAERLQAHAIDLRCPDAYDERPVRGLAEADVVVNAGGPRVRPGLRWGDYFREHVGVTTAVVRSMRPGAHLVHVSTTAVFGARPAVRTSASREAPTSYPLPAYACAKLAADAMARAIAAERGIEITVLRPSMVYGPGVDSALATLLRLHRRGVYLRLVPTTLRQHLVHIEVLLSVIERAVKAPVARDAGALLVADPFVLTNADLSPPTGRGPTLPVDTRLAASAHQLIARVFGASPGEIGALAALGVNETLDVEPTWRALGIDSRVFDRRDTFDAYWASGG